MSYNRDDKIKQSLRDPGNMNKEPAFAASGPTQGWG